MNFFASQDQAKTNTRKLVILFALAVISLILLTEALVLVCLGFTGNINFAEINSWQQLADSIGVDVIIGIAVVIIAVVSLASLFKMAQLSGGGKVIAETMGGTLLSPDSRDPDERKILNVVEEMAIASGTPVPPVYIIEQHGINAFAAGHTPKDAVIGITRGCIRALDRTELQGVVAHEFSHIFHGDMKLNLRLIAVLHGILILGILGYYLLRFSSGGRHRSSNNRNDGAAALIMLGAGLCVIGYTGTFFGNLIKAAVSRQREYLADASAIQYTRNPDSIAGALKKIGGYSLGSLVDNPHSSEISHLFFSEGVSTAFSSLMATHPPLDERIRRVDPHWNGKYIKVPLPEEVKANPASIIPTPKGPMVDKQKLAAAAVIGATLAGQQADNPAIDKANNTPSALDSIGEPGQAHLEEAGRLLTALPETLVNSAHQPFGARAIIYCLLFDSKNDNIIKKQSQILQLRADPNVYREALKLLPLFKQLDFSCRLPLLDICMPALKTLSAKQYDIFKSVMLALVKADYKIELFEWSIYRIVTHHLEPQVSVLQKPLKDLATAKQACITILSAIAIADSVFEGEAKADFDRAYPLLELPEGQFDKEALNNLENLDKSLNQLSLLAPLLKPRVIKACFACIGEKHDAIAKLELVRAIADGMDVPIPPILPGQPLY
ncbi:MAG: M48 family metallopeptidase [Pseudomonadales bacterium]|nr:M48 family metallopeptidase [Pseudomonadales bacterium]